MKYTITQSRLLYVMSIEDRRHQGLLKIGEVFVDNKIASSGNSSVLESVVREQLQDCSYLKDVTYELKLVECTTYDMSQAYKAQNVHDVLKNSGVSVVALNKKDQSDIWFKTDVSTVKRAIKAYKEGKKTFNGTCSLVKAPSIVFRPEQIMAIEKTVHHFSTKTGKKFLWNAKMRFGKTLSGLEVAKRLGYDTTLILTHRPVVDEGWRDDFVKIFGKHPEYVYATRMEEGTSVGDFYDLIQKVENKKNKLVFFVSIQFLRLSNLVGGKDNDPLKRDIMNYDWDLVMIDEAHEGTESTMGKRVIQKLTKENTHILSLSGTPFNLLDKYEEGEIYTWDYVMEQRAKHEWEKNHFGDPNPYADLPRMQILTFTMSDMLHQRIGDGNMFKFHEFFRVWTGEMHEDSKYFPNGEKPEDYNPGHFIYESQVKLFLDKLVENSATSQYPFSTPEFRANFRHTFWLLPYVREAAAMEALLKEHPVFKNFKIVNVAGDGNIEDEHGNALREVQDAIKRNKYTITLSCGKLTTGVSVPEWTAVLVLKGSENTPASSYMQTIFRVQTHALLNGRQKSDAYVFDFAPDRALTAVAEAAKMSVVSSQNQSGNRLKLKQKEEEIQLESFLKLCPVISMDGATMGRHFSANQLFEKLKNVYIERAVRSGYADNSLYNPDTLMNLTPEQEKALGDVHDLLGSMPNIWKPSKIEVNRQGFDGTKDAQDVQYIYFLSEKPQIPKRPEISTEVFISGAPKPLEKGWLDSLPQVDEIFQYCYVSYSVLKDDKWSDYYIPQLWKKFTVPTNKTEEQKQKEKDNQEKRARMSVLRGVSIRIPLLVYGAEINEDAGEKITIDNFTDIIDDASWEEYMPTGFTKETFNLLKECFDRSIFTGAATRIRQMVKSADDLDIEERIDKIASIFACFHNPDKETVLTPWRVVNMHISDCLGGWCFFNDQFDGPHTELNEFGEEVRSVRFVSKEGITKEIFGDYNTRILEINSKTGLYPLFMAYSVFKTAKEKAYREIGLTGIRGYNKEGVSYLKQVVEDEEIWKDVLQDNIFVVCRTPMAVSITKRTLAGFKNFKMNVVCYKHPIGVKSLLNMGLIKKNDEKIEEKDGNYYYQGQAEINCDMVDVIRCNPDLFTCEIAKGNDFWNVYKNIPKKENENINQMKFNAIVGNPPYQLAIPGRSEQPPIYHVFWDLAIQNSSIASLITPARFLFNAGKTPTEWNHKMLNDCHYRVVGYYPDSRTIFPNVEIKGGVTYGIRNANVDYGAIHEFVPVTMMSSIISKVQGEKDFTSITNILFSNTAHKYSDKIFKENPILKSRLSGGSLRYLASSALKVLPEVFFDEKPQDGLDYIVIIGLKDNSRIRMYFRRDYLCAPSNFGNFKMFISSSNGTGEFGEKLTMPFVGYPNEGATETYMSVGNFDSKEEAENLIKYIQCKFTRALLSAKKVTQGLKNSDVWVKIPLQDFSSSSDINWLESIAKIDQQLYSKYGLTKEEIRFIESNVKEM